MSKLLRYFLNVFFLLMLLLEFSFSQTLDNKINADNKETQIPISLQLKWKHQFQFAGYYAAKFKGFYAEEGLDVTIYEGNRQEDPIKNVLSGKIDFGISDVDVLYYKMQGNPLVVVAAIFQHSHHILLTKKSSDIRKPSDLIGKKIMISDYIGVAQLNLSFSEKEFQWIL
jgi:ABC-type nitrate/sulfonate/bicarbonate transport system substrate-binding protein